ncbi:MAG: hypothetical protein WCL18_09925 [bacterium]
MKLKALYTYIVYQAFSILLVAQILFNKILIMLGMLFTEILYRPIFNILAIFLAIFGGNLGVAIILLTVTIRLLMVKQTLAGNDMQKGM